MVRPNEAANLIVIECPNLIDLGCCPFLGGDGTLFAKGECHFVELESGDRANECVGYVFPENCDQPIVGMPTQTNHLVLPWEVPYALKISPSKPRETSRVMLTRFW